MRSWFDSLTSASTLLHLVSLSAFAVAALVFMAQTPSEGSTPEPEAPPTAATIRITLFGNVLGEVELPEAE